MTNDHAYYNNQLMSCLQDCDGDFTWDEPELKKCREGCHAPQTSRSYPQISEKSTASINDYHGRSDRSYSIDRDDESNQNDFL